MARHPCSPVMRCDLHGVSAVWGCVCSVLIASGFRGLGLGFDLGGSVAFDSTGHMGACCF